MKNTLLFLMSSYFAFGSLIGTELDTVVSNNSNSKLMQQPSSLLTEALKKQSASHSIAEKCPSPELNDKASMKKAQASPITVTCTSEAPSPSSSLTSSFMIQILRQVSFDDTSNDELKYSQSKNFASSPELYVLPLLIHGSETGKQACLSPDCGPETETPSDAGLLTPRSKSSSCNSLVRVKYSKTNIQDCLSPDCGPATPESDAGVLTPRSSRSSYNNLMRVHSSQRSIYDCGGFNEGSPDSTPDKDVLTRLRSSSETSPRARQNSNEWGIGSGLSISSVSPGTPNTRKNLTVLQGSLARMVNFYKSND